MLKIDKEKEIVQWIAVAANFIKFQDAALHQIPIVPSLFALEMRAYTTSRSYRGDRNRQERVVVPPFWISARYHADGCTGLQSEQEI